MISKRGQLKISFGMIFSIILIIIFLTFTFWGIKKFVSISNSVKIADFKDNLQEGVDSLWRGSKGSDTLEYNLPSKIEFICFGNLIPPPEGPGPTGNFASIYEEIRWSFFETENMFVYPTEAAEGLDATTIKHIDIEASTTMKNPLCFENREGKITLTITKDYGDSLVTISE
jgi:hypothetical protein